MNLRTILTVSMIATTSVAAATPLMAAPLAPTAIGQERGDVQAVQYRNWHGGPGWRHGYGGHGYGGHGYGSHGHYGHGYYGHRHYGGGAAVLGGLAAGAIIGGAIANSRADANAQAYCQQRFRSYDAGSGTYLGNDGRRHSCP